MSDDNNEKLGVIPYIVSVFSFIPLLGILVGIAVITWGLVTKKKGGKILVTIGALGISFTVALYGSLFYYGFVKQDSPFGNVRAQMAKSQLTTVVQAIELYKLQNGKYPESLAILANSLPKDSMIMFYDMSRSGFSNTQDYFYYELVDKDHYYLLGAGKDNKPFTQDDILPAVKNKQGGKIGLILKTNKY